MLLTLIPESRDSIPSEIASGSRDPGTPGLKTLITTQSSSLIMNIRVL